MCKLRCTARLATLSRKTAFSFDDLCRILVANRDVFEKKGLNNSEGSRTASLGGQRIDELEFS
jgi:hypothetical protein